MDSMPVYNIYVRYNYCFIQGYNQTIFFICYISSNHSKNLTLFNKIAIQGAPQMAVDKEL